MAGDTVYLIMVTRIIEGKGIQEWAQCVNRSSIMAQRWIDDQPMDGTVSYTVHSFARLR